MRTFLFYIFIISIVQFACQQSQEKQTDFPVSNEEPYVALPNSPTHLPHWPLRDFVIYHSISEPESLHPCIGSSAVRSEILKYTQKTLVNIDLKTGSLMPELIVELPEVSADGLSYTFELRDDIFWDDGSALSNVDIEFTLLSNLCPYTDNPGNKSMIPKISDFIKDEVSPRKFSVTMKESGLHNLYFWTDIPVLQKNYYDPEGILEKYSPAEFQSANSSANPEQELIDWANNFNSSKYGRNPEYQNGLGNFELISWDPGLELVLQKKDIKNNTSLDQNKLPQKIIFRIIRDPIALQMEFKSQNIDVSTSLDPLTLEFLATDQSCSTNYHTAYVPTYNYTYAALNCKPDGYKRKPFFNNKQVRRAMALLTPVERINTIIANGRGIRVTGPVSPLKDDFNDSLKAIPFDPDSAAVLLRAAGWKDSDEDGYLDKQVKGEQLDFKIEIFHYNTTPIWGEMALLLADEFEKAGIKTDLVAMDYRLMNDLLTAHDFDIALGSWGGSGQPENFYQLWHTKSWIDGGLNYTGFGDKNSDRLIDSINISTSENERRLLSKRFQKLLYDEQPYIFLLSSVRRVAVHRRFQNIALYHERPGILLHHLQTSIHRSTEE